MELIDFNFLLTDDQLNILKNNRLIPAKNITIKTNPTIKAAERHPIVTIKSIFQGLNTEFNFLDEILAKKGSTFAKGIFQNFQIVFSFIKSNSNCLLFLLTYYYC